MTEQDLAIPCLLENKVFSNWYHRHYLLLKKVIVRLLFFFFGFGLVFVVFYQVGEFDDGSFDGICLGVE
jgi:hypothetical protein